jgi:hypothetical protein
MLIMGSQDTRMHHWLTEIAMEPKPKADVERLNGALARIPARSSPTSGDDKTGRFGS